MDICSTCKLVLGVCMDTCSTCQLVLAGLAL